MKSPGEDGVGQQPGLDVEAAEDLDPVSWGQRYTDARRRLDKVEQDISKLEAELSEAWDERKGEKLKQLTGDRSVLQQRMLYLEREKADLQEERNLVLKRETTATGTVHEDIARCHPACAWNAYNGTTHI
jgi:predicted  nucleic acid-binding Zn-ribbon protein